MGPKLQFVGERDETKIDLRWYPGESRESSIYEDDGESFAHESGKQCITRIEQQPIDGGYRCVVHPRQGSYAGQPESRTYRLRFCGDQKIKTITLDGETIATKTNRKGRVIVDFAEDVDRKQVHVIDVQC